MRGNGQTMVRTGRRGPANSAPRLDARPKVTGEARYAADIAVENPAYAVLVTSAVASGRISKLKLDAALSVPGVLDILSYQDAKTVKRLRSIGNADSDIRPLSSSRIWHDGQIIAVVVAETFEAARESAYRVDVDYKARTPSATFGSARTKTEAGDNENPHVGRAAAALKASQVTIDVEYETAAQHHNPMELFSTTCAWDGNKLTIYEPSQFVNGLRRGVGEQLRIKYANIRVVSKFVGGGFGSKGSITARTALIALVARRLKRPVKLVATRDQGFTIGSYRAETRHRIRLGAGRDGKLKALVHEGWELTSRPDSYFHGGTQTTCRMYAVPNVKSKVFVVHADRGTPGYMRAPSEFPYVYALEIALDELAVKLRMDPVELRRINDTKSDPITKLPYTSRSLMQCFDEAANAFGWHRYDPSSGTMRKGEWLIGWGCAAAIYPTYMSPSAARVTLTRAGDIRVDIAAHELGTGAMTVIAQTAAEHLCLDIGRVQVELGDSSLPPGPMAASSATTASACSVVMKACEAIRQRLSSADEAATLAEKFKQLRVDHIEEYAEWIPPGLVPADVHRDLHAGDISFDGGVTPDRLMFAFGAEFVEVRVNALTREIRVPRIVGAFAAGHIVNERTARSQLMGGMIWGVSSALHEQTEIDRKRARYVNDNLADYLIPVSADIEKVEVILVPEHDLAVNPAGVKGLGELGNVGTAAAISNAVRHATGKRVRRLPIRIEHLL
jgi:xanthine dehydrogenase YagR molybdenum-binding subunit